MRHRGRHRRHRRGRALRAGLAGTALALTAAATLITTSQAAGGDTPGPLAPLTSSAEMDDFRLRESLAPEATLDTLTEGMGGSVGIEEVLRSADHPMRNEDDCSDSERAALPVEPTATRAYCWDTDDATTQAWIPRSVTTSGDAAAAGTWGGDRVVLAGWTHTGGDTDGPAEDRGLARVAFIDATDPDDLRYRWVLLVAPRDSGRDFDPVRSRAGGMVWYQDKLIVTAGNGTAQDDTLLVFDLDRVLRADVEDDAIGRVDGGWSAHHHRYVLPAVGSYRPTGGPCTTARDDAFPCLASLSLDRTSTPHSLVAVESPASDSAPDSGDDEPTRVWRYPFSTSADRTGLLGAGPFGYVDAEEAYETEAAGVRSVLSHRESAENEADWYVGHTPGRQGPHGTLWRQDEDGADSARCTADGSRACWGRHTESLSYWPQTGELWTLTERTADLDGEAGKAGEDHGNGEGASPDGAPERVLYAVPLASVDESME
ncbi:hypothetical protein [Streptomyces poonensis]|uniref:Secreted protein n=1 Tax=Streptomyces poonensis TaxID=68255 RepID=A0A918UT10_9ACTN|nr:hypothetical protein [Streptomyces poonensis]GGZ31896.1 hypothetical protein GCM10010365_60700 [Streptomyces poonensis]GLJ93376.1 hypothetical protein GCM10017589_59880 [Streptomyces poonensis]